MAHHNYLRITLDGSHDKTMMEKIEEKARQARRTTKHRFSLRPTWAVVVTALLLCHGRHEAEKQNI